MRGSLGFLFFQPNGQLNENINCLRFEYDIKKNMEKWLIGVALNQP